MAITNNQTSGFHPRLSLLKNSPTLIHPNFRCVASLTKIFLESLPPFYTYDPYPRLHHSSLKYCRVLLNDLLVSSIYPPMLRVIIQLECSATMPLPFLMSQNNFLQLCGKLCLRSLLLLSLILESSFLYPISTYKLYNHLKFPRFPCPSPTSILTFPPTWNNFSPFLPIFKIHFIFLF